MTGFMAWAGTVCMAAAGCTALHMLIGKEGTGKIFRLLTAAFFLCAVFSPLLSAKDRLLPLLPIQADTVDTDTLQMQSMRQIRQSTEEILLKTVNTALASHGLKAQKVEIRMDTSADGSISITNITLFLERADSLQRVWVKQIAEQRLGTEVEVTVAE